VIDGSDVDRPRLRQALLAHAPWLADPDHGPTTVEAGDCDRCGAAPRLVGLCGPTAWQAVCRDCAVAVGDEGWCDGHAAEGEAAREWAASLPDGWAPAVLLWWLATGELRRLEFPDRMRPAVPTAVLMALPR
jgi:hypothetical protein